MIQSLIIYFCLAIITSVLAEFASRSKTRVQRTLAGILTVIIPSFMASIRYNTGTDYNTYVRVFNDIQSKSMVEIGYEKLNLFVKYIGGNVELVFFIMSAIMMTCILLSLLKNKGKISVGVGMFIFMLLYYQRSYNIMRQMTAVSILIYAISSINDKKIFKVIILTCVATTIHYSSIIILPFYFILKYLKKEDRGAIRILFIIIFSIFFFNYDKILLPIFESNKNLVYYSGYLQRNESGKFGFGVFIEYIPYILSCSILYKDFKKCEIFYTYYIMLILGIILESSVYFFANGAANRIALVFTMPTIIIVPMCIRKFMKKKKYIWGTFLIIFVMIIWYNTYFYKGYHQTVPYDWIF